MNFGKWIVVAFIFFAVFIGTLVTVCVRQDVNLVSKEYYQDELQYQQKLDKINNANHLAHQPSIEVGNGSIKISFAEASTAQKGVLKIQRPSNIKLDREFSLQPDQPTQEFNLGNWEPGLYRASLSWTMNDKEYFIEKQIVL
jgi:hypothetical protein